MDGEHPEVGRGAKLLGVRCGMGESDDLPVNGDEVEPGTGGMSVAPSLDALPSHRLPRRLKTKYPDRFSDAAGSDRLHCWSMGEGEFLAGPVASDLVLRLDPERPNQHGFVEPDKKMLLTDYEKAIAATRELWIRWGE